MTSRKIPFVDLAYKFRKFQSRFHEDLDRVLSSGSFILGSELPRLEDAVRRFTGAEQAIGVANGTDALMLCLKACSVGPGTEVITTPMSYLATTSSIALCGAEAVFVDVDDTLNLDPNRIEAAITKRTRAVSVVHLAGIPARIDRIKAIADKHGLAVIEDCAQSLGASYAGQSVGTFGRFGAVSFHPLKNLGTVGDAGLILAQREEDAAWLRQSRNHGHKTRDLCDFWSVNSRLDELHAAFLSTQLETYPSELTRRRRLADIYRVELTGVLDFPAVPDGAVPSYNWIMVMVDRREELIAHLEGQGIEVKIHYPVLIPDLEAASRNCRIHGDIPQARTMVQRILSLPTAEHVSETDVHYVCRRIKDFYGCGTRSKH